MVRLSPLLTLFLQSLLVTLQIINAAIATLEGVPVVLVVSLAAVLGGFQFFVQHLGNGMTPAAKPPVASTEPV